MKKVKKILDPPALFAALGLLLLAGWICGPVLQGDLEEHSVQAGVMPRLIDKTEVNRQGGFAPRPEEKRLNTIYCRLEPVNLELANLEPVNLELANLEPVNLEPAKTEKKEEELEAVDSQLKELFPACCWVESKNNRWPIGDNGQSIGIVHIQKKVVEDVNQILGCRRFCFQDRWSKEKSREIFFIYLGHYGRQYHQETGYRPNQEVYARIWNGGPSGWKSWSTEKYWHRISRCL